jgi:inorganic pyrophosphatase
MAVAFEDNEMDLSRIPVGENPPHEVNVIIEIPQGGAPVKYEVDKVSGAMFVDRFLHTAMFYPANYGFIPHTLSEDGDPIDCMVIAPTPVATGAAVRARPIGALLMEDEKGVDEKIIAVPVDKLHPFYKRVASYRDLPEILVERFAVASRPGRVHQQSVGARNEDAPKWRGEEMTGFTQSSICRSLTTRSLSPYRVPVTRRPSTSGQNSRNSSPRAFQTMTIAVRP